MNEPEQTADIPFQLIVESATNAMILVDQKGLITFVNRMTEVAFGYSRHELIGQGIEILIPERFRAHHPGFRKMFFASPSVRAMGTGRHLHAMRRDGSEFPVDIGLNPVETAEGLVVLAIIIDITERKKFEEQRSLFSSIVNSSDDAILSKDLEGKILTWNHGAEKIFGYTAEEIIGRHISMLIPYELREEENEIIEKIKKGEFVDHYETRRARKDGRVIDVSLTISPIRDTMGKVIGASKISRDITDQKAIKQKLEKSEKHYRMLVEQAADGIFLSDPHGNYIDVNIAGCRMLGYTHEEITGLSIADVIMRDEIPRIGIEVEKFSNGAIVTSEWRFKRKDGSWFPGELIGRALPDGNLQAILRDITEHKKAKEKIMKANRLYAFISAINQSIVHIRDEQELLNNTCNVAIEIGQFKLAWIDMVDEPTGKLMIASLRGASSAVNEVPKYSGADVLSPISRSTLTEKVLATGMYAVCNDAQNDPMMEVWRKELAVHGVNSIICMPVKKFGKVTGVFRLYSETIGFFDDSEIGLLEEAAKDISFALENFEKEKQRMQIQEELIKYESNLVTIFENTDIGLLLMDMDYNVIASNEMIGVWSKASFGDFLTKGMNLKDRLHPERLKNFESLMNMLRAGGQFNIETHHRDATGILNWFIATGKPVKDINGKSIGLCLAVTDITEKKKAEQKIQFDKSNLDALINNTQDQMWSVDTEHKLITYNQPMHDVIKNFAGVSISKGAEILSFSLTGEQRERYKGWYTRAFAGEVFTEVEHIAAPVDLWREISFYPIRDGEKVIGSACHSRDVTDRIRTENKIRELNEKLIDANRELLTILNTLPANIALLNDEGVIIAVDEAWKKFADDNNMQNNDYGVGQNYVDVCEKATGIHSEGAVEMARGIDQVLSGELNKFALEYPCPSPWEERWFRAEVRPLVENERSGAVVMHINTTEQKMAENKIVELNETLEQRVQERTAELSEANKALEAFSYSVSHDLRAPIRTMVGFSKMIQQDYADKLDPEIQELLGYIDSGGKRMSEIIDDLLKLAKYDREKLQLAPVDMQELVNGLWHSVSRSTPHHAVLELVALPTILADRSMIEQVVINLLSNAIKYSSKKEKPMIRVWCEKSKDSATFFFKDNGAGFDMKNYDRLFGAFQRLHGMGDFEGTGVGLTLVKRIIEKHGGSVGGEGVVDEGATFHFTLPD